MTKLTNYLCTMTEIKSMGFPYLFPGSPPADSDYCVTKLVFGNNFLYNWYYGLMYGYDFSRLPRYQDFLQVKLIINVTKAPLQIPVYDTLFYYQITVNIDGSADAGPVQDIRVTDTLPVGMTLLNFAYVYANDQPFPNPTSNYYTVNIFQSNTPSGAFDISIKPGAYAINRPTFDSFSPITIGFTAKATTTGSLTNTAYATIPSGAFTYQTSGSNTINIPTTTTTTSTTSTSTTTTTTTTFCPTCTYATSIGTTTSCSGSTATKNVTINTSCVNNSEARLVAIGNGAITTGWVTLTSLSAIYSFTSTNIGTYRVEARGKSIVTTCPASFISGEFNVCCNTSPTWVNTGSQYCDGCAIKQLQTDTNFCSSTYNTTRIITISASDASCGIWGPQTQYCANYGVYPFQLRTRETNTCGQTRNDSFVANLSPTCGYGCSYWGLSISFSVYYCNGSTSNSGVVSVNANANNGSFEVRLVSVGSGVTTAWNSFNTFTGVVDGVYYAQIRSTSDTNCIVGTQDEITIACCSTVPTWTPEGAAYCENCVSKQLERNTNPCSSTYNQTQVINGGSACNTTQNWVNTGSYNCYGTCNKYNVEIQNNPCASGYNTTRQGSVVEYNSTFCGGCCGQSTAANWVNSGSYNCYGSCTKYNVEVDNNGCSPTYNQTRQGSAVEFNSAFCGGCCGASPSANWVNNGDTFCDGCYLQQPQIDDNLCSSTYGDTRNVDLGVNTSCGYWIQSFYCVGYNKWTKETNTCTGSIRNNYEVEANSPYCGYVPPPTCRTYQIIGYNSDEYVDGVYTNCAGFPDSFSFYGGPGTVGYICAQPSSVYITSGNGAANDVGSC